MENKNQEILKKLNPKLNFAPSGEIIDNYGQASEMIVETAKAVIEGRLYESAADYWLLKWYAPEAISNGTTSITYVTKANPVTNKIATSGEMSNTDYKRNNNVVISETFILHENTDDVDSAEYDIYDQETVDFRRGATEALGILQNQIRKVTTTIDKRQHQKIGQTILDGITLYVDWGTLSIEEKIKLLISTLTTYSSTTDDLVSATFSSETKFFDYSNPANNYHAIWGSTFYAEYGVDLVRNSFQRIEGFTESDGFLKNRSIDFTKELAFKDATIPAAAPITDVSEIDLILLQPTKTKNFRHYTLSKLVPTKYNYSSGIDYIKQNGYSRKDNVSIIFYTSAPATIKK